MLFRFNAIRFWAWLLVPCAVGLLVLVLPDLDAERPRLLDAPDGSQRVISLVPAITGTLVALDATEGLVGRSDWCSGSRAIDKIPAMGTLLTPQLESIALAQPATVLADGSMAAGLDALSAIAPVQVLPWLRAEEVAASVRVLGEMLERGEQAERLASGFDRLAEATPAADAPRVLLALEGSLQQGEVWYIRPHSLHGEALAMAGYRNAIEEPITGPPVLSLEGLLQLSPDAIVVLGAAPITERERSKTLARWSVFTTLDAVREGNVAVLGGPELLSTGPDVLALPDRLRETLRAFAVGSP